jgi:hypothetical protein
VAVAGVGLVLARCKANATIGVSALSVTQSGSDTTVQAAGTADGTKPWLAVATDTSTAVKANAFLGVAGETADTSGTGSPAAKKIFMTGPGVGPV